MRRLLPLLPLAIALGACFVSFDPNGQPCSPDGGCLASYHCQAGKCVAGPTTGGGGTTTGGGTGGTSGSSGSPDAGCTAASCGAQRCLPATGQCAPRDCAHTVCPVNQVCQPADGGPACVSRPAGDTTHPCGSDADCAAPYACLLPAGAAGLTGGTPGFCTNTCVAGPDGGCAGTDVCSTLTNARGAPVGLCLPATPPRACAADAPCRDFGLACAYFDLYQSPSGLLPVAFCDASDAGPAGGRCTGPADCRSRACVGGLCAPSCAADADCGAAQHCRVAAAQGLAFHARACLAGSASMGTCCLSSATCALDTDTCDLATHACALGCRPEEVAPCGPGSSCGPTGTCSYDAGFRDGGC